MELTLLVLAAGMGTRYGGLKQVAPLGPGGEALLDYSVYDALRAGFARVVFVIRRDVEAAFRGAIGARFEAHIRTGYVFQELNAIPAGFSVAPSRTKPWGTGHAVLAAAGTIDAPFVAVNADDFYGPTSYAVVAEHLRDLRDSHRQEHAMVGFDLRNTLSDAGPVSRGVCRSNPDGTLAEITEVARIKKEGDGARFTDETGTMRALSGSEIVSMNMWGFAPVIFGHLQNQFRLFLAEHGQDEKAEFQLPTAVGRLVAAGEARVRVLTTPDTWCGVTYPQDRPRTTACIRRFIEQGVYPDPLWT